MRPWVHVSCMVTPQNRVLETLTHGPGAQLGDTTEQNQPLERDVGSYPACPVVSRTPTHHDCYYLPQACSTGTGLGGSACGYCSLKKSSFQTLKI